MKTLEWNTQDKTFGPWQNEPDKMQYLDQATGLPCLIVRNNSGALCGYVGVSQTHLLHNKYYTEVDVDVHGGLTFSSACQITDDPSEGICHLTEPGDSDNIWWFGFDCAHYNDLVPNFPNNTQHEVYRDIAYVKKEIERLAKQLIEKHGTGAAS